MEAVCSAGHPVLIHCHSEARPYCGGRHQELSCRWQGPVLKPVSAVLLQHQECRNVRGRLIDTPNIAQLKVNMEINLEGESKDVDKLGFFF